MDNQHKKITGYRDLSQEEIDLMNTIKNHGEALDYLIKALGKARATDKRWLSIGTMELQKGIMSLVRSVAKPKSF